MLPSLIIIYIIIYNVTRTNNSNHVTVTALCPQCYGLVMMLHFYNANFNEQSLACEKKIEIYPAQPVLYMCPEM